VKEKDSKSIIVGGQNTDERGTVSYFNDFDLSPVKRLYILENANVNVVRAWQGHKHEQKWFHAVAGNFEIVLVKPNNWESPSNDLEYTECKLHAENNSILHVPGGYVTGIKATSPNAKLLVFSDFTVAESKNDDYRFDKDLWYNWKS
jgi:dTDP-4-dehydrorhamnose 3,5-epimerase-like enzyme